MKIFISYSRDVRDQVSDLAATLQQMNHVTWWDNDLNGGNNWWKKILDEICLCDLFMFILDPSSLSSEACLVERSYALSNNKRILPILLHNEVNVDLLPAELVM